MLQPSYFANVEDIVLKIGTNQKKYIWNHKTKKILSYYLKNPWNILGDRVDWKKLI